MRPTDGRYGCCSWQCRVAAIASETGVRKKSREPRGGGLGRPVSSGGGGSGGGATVRRDGLVRLPSVHGRARPTRVCTLRRPRHAVMTAVAAAVAAVPVPVVVAAVGDEDWDDQAPDAPRLGLGHIRQRAVDGAGVRLRRSCSLIDASSCD